MSEEAELIGKGWAFPPRIGSDGRVAWSEGADNVRESIRIILMTELEERVMLPGFGAGLRSFLFQPNTTAVRQLIRDRVQRALRRWEPRIRLQDVRVETDPRDPTDGQAAVLVVDYRLAVTGEAGELRAGIRFGS